jgi:predicted transcriptional regulator
MHDFVDETIVIRELEGHAPSNIMTTWHSADSLEEAVEFAVVSAEPDDQYVAGCGAVVLATVENAEWAEQVQQSASQHVI